jgi:hypothetical protein
LRFHSLDGLWFEIRTYRRIQTCTAPFSPQHPFDRRPRQACQTWLLDQGVLSVHNTTGQRIRMVEPLLCQHNSTLASSHGSESEAVVIDVPGLRYRSPKTLQLGSRGPQCSARREKERRSSSRWPIARPPFPRLAPSACPAETGRGRAHTIHPVSGGASARLGAAGEAGECPPHTSSMLSPASTCSRRLSAKRPALGRRHVRETPAAANIFRHAHWPMSDSDPWRNIQLLVSALSGPGERAVRGTSHPKPDRQVPEPSHLYGLCMEVVCW